MNQRHTPIGIILFCLLFFSCKPSSEEQYELIEAFPKLRFRQMTELVTPPDGSNRLWVTLQQGKIEVFENDPDVTSSQTFLDISDLVATGGERGLLGLAFHPKYTENGYFYINYTRNQGELESVIARFQVSKDNPDRADPASQLILLTYRQPFGNHNAGKLDFGQDGFLYIATGDGGSAGDPEKNGQNLESLLGKMLRIDVDQTTDGKNYAIPSDNPFKGNTKNYREEIYAYGLRNPWKFSFDPKTGQLWAADVGQNALEEIDLIENGKNYGWRIMEASACFDPSEGCNTENLILPVWEYSQSEGDRSITGGYVYRGQGLQGLQGNYIYGDFVSGKIWALDYQNNTASNQLLMDTKFAISTFGIDQGQNLYVCAYSGTGKIFKLTQKNIVALSSKVDKPLNYTTCSNPSENTFTIEFFLNKPMKATLSLYNNKGKKAKKILEKQSLQAGKQHLEFSKNNIPSGIYFLRLSLETIQKTLKVILE